jgi:hypothetical protein
MSVQEEFRTHLTKFLRKKVVEVKTPKDMRKVRKYLFQYLNRIGKKVGFEIKEEHEMPKLVEYLLSNGHISKTMWMALTDFIAFLDVIEYQEKLVGGEKQLLHACISEMKRVGTDEDF